MYIYENCTLCPFHKFNGSIYVCGVYKIKLLEKGNTPIPPSGCVHSIEYNKNREQVLKCQQ